MKITLVRHGDVDEAYHHCYNGHIDIGLSQKGKEQAQALAKRFESASFDYVFCSDLLRARETLAPFKQAKEAIYTDRLREKSWGRHEGMCFDAIVAEDNIVYENFTQWLETLDGEGLKEYIARVESFFLEDLLSLEAEDILIVTHAGVIRVLMAIVQKISLETAFSKALPYGSFVVFDTKKQTFSTVK